MGNGPCGRSVGEQVETISFSGFGKNWVGKSGLLSEQKETSLITNYYPIIIITDYKCYLGGIK